MNQPDMDSEQDLATHLKLEKHGQAGGAGYLSSRATREGVPAH